MTAPLAATKAAAITLRAGEPFVLHVALRDAIGAPQLLTGRTFGLVIAAVGATTPAISMPATLSADGFYAVTGLTGEHSAALHADFGARACAYAIIETTGGAQITRGAGGVRVEASAAIPSGGDPVTLDLPYMLAIPTPAGLLITETGARGLSAAEQFAIGGLDAGDPMTGAMFAALGDGIRAEVEGSADAAAGSAAQAGDMRAATQDIADIVADDAVKVAQDKARVAADLDAAAMQKAIAVQAAVGAADAAAAAGIAASLATYADAAAGAAAVPDGYFWVKGTGDIALHLLKATAGVPGSPIASISDRSALAAVEKSVAANTSSVGTHLFVDGFGTVFAGLKAAGRDFFLSNGQMRIETDGKVSFLTSSDSPTATTPIIQEHGNGTTTFGVADLKVRFDTDEGITTIDGLVVDGATLTQVGPVEVSLFSGTGYRLQGGDGTVFGQFADISSFGGWVFDGPGNRIYDPDGAQVYPIDFPAPDGAALTQVGPVHVASYADAGVTLQDGSTVFARFGGVSGFGGWVFDDTGKIYYEGAEFAPGMTPSSQNFPSDYIVAKSIAASLATEVLRARRVSPIKGRGIMSAYNLCLIYGQSNSLGTQSFPAQSVSNTFMGRTHGGLMIGQSIHAASQSGDWAQIGALQLNPLVATVRGTANGTLLTAAEQYALNWSANNMGQTLMEGAVTTFDWLRLRDLGKTSDATKFICYAAGSGGRTLAQLSKGNAAGLYPRITQGAALASALAGPTMRRLFTIFSQGEADGADSTSAATWKALFRQWRIDEHADVAVAICGEDASEPAAPVFMLQTCAHGIVTSGALPAEGLVIANAQLELAQREDNVFIVSGYAGTKKGIHFTANSTAWNSQMIGYQLYQYFALGEVPFAFAPHEIEVKGNQMLVTFIVPNGPIRFQDVYGFDETGTTMRPWNTTNKGFYPRDDDGLNTVMSVQIVEDNCILITCSRSFATNACLDYGTRTNPIGAGNVFDSTDFQFFNHLYDPAKGYAAQIDGVPSYTNEPFPPGFALCLFTRPAVAI